jgi:hypothetical protein
LSSFPAITERGDRTQDLATIAENDTHFLQILISQIGKHGEIDAILGKALGVLGHAKPIEPVRNLLHCGAPSLSHPCDAARQDIGLKEAICWSGRVRNAL